MLFWRAWLGAIIAVAVVYVGGIVTNSALAIGLQVLGVLLTVAGAWWVHRSARTAPPAQPVEPPAVPAVSPAAAAAMAEPPAPVSPAGPELVGAARSLSQAIASLREQAGTGEAQIKEVWTLTGRVNDLLTDLHHATGAQLRDLDRTRSLAREVVASAEVMTGQVGEVLQGAGKRKAAVSRVEEGLKEIASSMKQIQRAVDDSAATIQELKKHSAQIGEIVRMIRAIAEQTNMLSLNAAIEASRAGAAGRGFAVVAEEVRKLADRSRVATRQIEELVSAIREGTVAATQAMSAGQEKVALGASSVTTAHDAMEEIVAATEQLDATVMGFGQQAGETTRRMGELLKAVEEVANLADQNTSTMKQLAEADWFSKAIKAAEKTAGDMIQATATLSAEAEALVRKLDTAR